ncbi:MAG: type IV secretion protein IcmC [Tatlockia sp.]|nr:type IV secretion protein IcmC [Tatlockia sp.]
MSANTDLITMLGNLSGSLFSVQRLLEFFSYLLGLGFFITALTKFKKIGESRGRSQEKGFVPLAFFLGGAALLYLPTVVRALSATTFGMNNILNYTSFNPYNIYNSMGILLQTAGIIWFIRGCVLLVHASEPGEKHGSKGFVFICAGILAMNYRNTASALSSALEYLISVTGVKNNK